MRRFFEVLFRSMHRRELAMLSSLRGPTPVFLLGNGLDLIGGNLHVLFEKWRAQYGDTFAFWIFGKPSLVVARPEDVVDVLVTRKDDWFKNVPRAATKPVGGESVFRSPGGADWKERRERHPFEQRWVESFYDRMTPIIRGEALARFDPLAKRSAMIDLYQEILKTTWDCFSLGVFGEKLPPEAFDEHEVLLREVGNRGALPVAFSWNPIFWWKRAKWFRRIEARLARGSLGQDATDLTSMLARHGVDLKTRAVRDELSNIFAAGMKNAAIVASAALYLLLRHTESANRTIAELDGLGPEPVRTDLLALPYFDRAVRESLRLYPAVTGFVREAKPDRTVELGGVKLPQGTQVFLLSWVVHRHPELWAEPERFDPDRFLVEPKPGTYFPFGLGERYCVGRDWTLLTSKVIVATLLSRYAMTLAPEASFETKLVASLAVPKNGVPATIRSR